jgi:hypothetical protein
LVLVRGSYSLTAIHRFLSKKRHFSAMNCGYALLTQSGETLQLNSKVEKYQQFQLQMYHYAALGIKFQESLQGKRILDLCCGRGGGGKASNNTKI